MTREEAIEVLQASSIKQMSLTKIIVDGKSLSVKVALDMAIKALEQEPKTFKWCTDCKEYDQEKHCCHRWSKVIRNTVEEIEQEYIEREVLDKIRAELLDNVCEVDRYKYNYLIPKSLIDRVFDKYKAEREALADIYKPTLKADLCIMDEFAFMPQAETEAEDGNDD